MNTVLQARIVSAACFRYAADCRRKAREIRAGADTPVMVSEGPETLERNAAIADKIAKQNDNYYQAFKE